MSKKIFIFTMLLSASSLLAQPICIDYSNANLFPNQQIQSNTVLTNSPNTTYTIGNGNMSLNTPSNAGLYGSNSSVLFAINNANQQLTFAQYGIPSQFSQMGFSIDGGSTVFFNQTFPQTISGATVNFQLGAPINSTFTSFNLTVTGSVSSVRIFLFESGITSYCSEELVVIDPIEMGCIDFSNSNTYPTESFGPNLSQAINPSTSFTTSSNGFLSLNSGANPGLYGAFSHIISTFDGSNQQVIISQYGFQGQFNQMGFSVNGSTQHLYNETFPQIINGINCTLSVGATNGQGITNFDLILNGIITTTDILLFESGITQICSNDSQTTGIEEISSENNLYAFPNPFTNQVRLSSKSKIDEIEIFTILGEEVGRFVVNDFSILLDLSSLTQGMYLIRSSGYDENKIIRVEKK